MARGDTGHRGTGRATAHCGYVAACSRALRYPLYDRFVCDAVGLAGIRHSPVHFWPSCNLIRNDSKNRRENTWKFIRLSTRVVVVAGVVSYLRMAGSSLE